MGWTLVTGGGKNLGAEVCITLARHGYPILVHYNKSKEEALEIVNVCRRIGTEAECVCGDFSTIEGVETFIEKAKEFGKIENLINNVGTYAVKSGLETPTDVWVDIFQTNIHTRFMLSKAFSEDLKSFSGSIINIGVVGLQNLYANTYCTAYMCAKHALWALTCSLAKELASSQVRVNMVSPGYLSTSVGLPDVTTLPMGRAATFREVADVIVFLLNKNNRYITSQDIEVAGGYKL